MKKVIVVIFVLVMATYAYGEDVKIGYIDMQRALNEAEAGKIAKAELEVMVKERQTVIDDKIALREKLVAELEKQAVVLSEDARRQKQDELEKLTRELERMISDSNAELQNSQRELERTIFNDIDVIIKEIGKEGGYTFIIPSDIVLFSVEGADLTDTVIDRYNKLYEKKSKKK